MGARSKVLPPRGVFDTHITRYRGFFEEGPLSSLALIDQFDFIPLWRKRRISPGRRKEAAKINRGASLTPPKEREGGRGEPESVGGC